MAGLQRSVTSFRRQGSSGLVWEDRLLSGGDSNQIKQKEEQQQETVLTDQEKPESNDVKPAARAVGTIERSRSNGSGGHAFRTGKVSPAIEPPSPKLSACGFCSAFGKPPVRSRRRKPDLRRA